MSRRSIKTVHVAGASGLLALGAIACLLGVKPMLDRHREDRSLKEATADALSRRDADEAILKRCSVRLKRAVQALESAPIELRPLAALNQQVKALTTLGEEAGIQLDQLNPGQPIKGARFMGVPIRVGGSGRYPAMAEFLRRLSLQHRDTALRGLKLAARTEAAGSDPDGPLASFTLDLVWFASLPDATPAPSAGPIAHAPGS